MVTTLAPVRVDAARTLAGTLLSGLGDRWRHTAAVARRAAELGATVHPADRDTLVAAAWLHDIGYSPALAGTGFHPLDGAVYLDRHGWPRRISALVAQHSGAEYLAGAHSLASGHSLAAALDRYPHERSPVSDALCYADQTVGPAGERLTLDARMAEMLDRHGPDSVQASVHHLREPYLRAVAHRVERRLRQRA
jgi:putative nucleotidyltransferase with HDIG domain